MRKKIPLAVKHIEFLKLLKNIPQTQRGVLFAALPNEIINTFSEVCSNFLQQRIPINKNRLRKLAKNKKTIKAIALKKNSLKKLVS